MTIANDHTAALGAKPGWQPNALTGIFYMCLAVSIFPPMNAIVKYLGSIGYPYGQIVWARYFFHVLIMLAMFAPSLGWSILKTRHPVVQGVRSILLFTCTSLYFYAIQFVDLTLAASISFTSPILLTALSVPFLGEKVGLRRWIAVAIGFGGALIIIRPGGDSFHWAALLVVGNTVSYSFYQLLTRKIAGDDRPETTIFYTAVVGSVIASALLVRGFEMPRTIWHGVMFVAVGAMGGFGHFFVVKAFQHAKASVVAPFGYGQLVGATLCSYFIFDHFPDELTFVGAAIITASGLYIAYREQQVRRQAAPAEPAAH